jgi:hypothetical protein
MRMFELVRHHDVSGVSGTGIVAEGVVWTDGAVALRWYGEHPSTEVWSSLDDMLAVHGHEGETIVHFLDAAVPDRDAVVEVLHKAHHNTTCTWPRSISTPCPLLGEAEAEADAVLALVQMESEAQSPPTPKQLAAWTLAEERALDAADNEAGDDLEQYQDPDRPWHGYPYLGGNHRPAVFPDTADNEAGD